MKNGGRSSNTGNASGAAEVYTHELGHALGFGHATDAQAVMRAQHHNDGRGARLGEDDRVGASVVYGDGSYRPAPAEPGPGAGNEQPFRLAVAATTQTTVALSWTTSLADVAGFRVELMGKKGRSRVLASVSGDRTKASSISAAIIFTSPCTVDADKRRQRPTLSLCMVRRS